MSAPARRLPLGLTPETQKRGARTAARRRQEHSVRTQALALAQKGAFTLAELHAEAGRTRQACYLAAKGLVKEGLLRHVPGKTATAAAQYALTAPATVRGMAVVNSGHARVQLGVQRAAAEQLSAAEAFLASKEPLPPARPPVFHERGARHG